MKIKFPAILWFLDSKLNVDRKYCNCCRSIFGSSHACERAHQWWYCWPLQPTAWTWGEDDMCLSPSAPHPQHDCPAHLWMEMWELLVCDWSISGCCRARLIFSCNDNNVSRSSLGFKSTNGTWWWWTVCLRSDTWVRKTGASWRNWFQQQCCYRQNELLLAPAGSDDKNALCPCAQNGDRCHWTWASVKTMSYNNGRQTKLFFGIV